MIDYENLGKLNAPFENDFLRFYHEFVKSGWYVLGQNVREFENAFAAFQESKHCVGLASGLDALILALDVLDLTEGAEVIVPSNTYIATVLAVIRCGCRPVLVEPDIRTYNIDPRKIEEAITSNTGAIMPVHLYGKSCDMTSIRRIADLHGLKIIEDCAQAHGCEHKGVRVGSFSEVSAFSFYPTKNLGALGDAGAAVTDDAKTAERLRALRNYGSSKKYYNDFVGYNSRLDEIQAGFLTVKLRSLNLINQHKRKLAAIYLEGLCEELLLPDPSENVFHIFPVRTRARDDLRDHLLACGIKTEVHYPVPPHRQNALKGLFDGETYPISEEIHRTELSLPISYFHTEEDVLKVVDAINAFFR